MFLGKSELEKRVKRQIQRCLRVFVKKQCTENRKMTKTTRQKNKKFVAQSRTGLQIYEGHDDQLNRPGPMA
jgi:hypothetical protein